jgi:hypothetical protein
MQGLQDVNTVQKFTEGQKEMEEKACVYLPHETTLGISKLHRVAF